MADARGGQSSVRSLLAKFENNNNNANASTTSPPSRGRSPVASDTSTSDRPLSKVRASFVAVERAAQASPGPPPSGLRNSVELDGGSPDDKTKDGLMGRRLASPIERRGTASPTGSMDKHAQSRPPTSSPSQWAAELAKPNNTNSGSPWKARSTSSGDSGDPGIAGNGTPALGEILKGAPFEQSPSKKTSKPAGQLPSDSPRPKKGTEPLGLASGNGENAQETTESASKPAPTTQTGSSRPSNITVTKDAGAKTATQQPKSPRTPTTSGPSQPSTTTTTTTATTNSPAANKDAERRSRVAVKKPSSVRASSHPAGKAPAKPKPESSETSTQNGGKSSAHSSPRNSRKTRSPTRPVRLPSSMTASTASSAAKLNNNSGDNNAQTSRPASRATGNTASYARKTSSSKPPGNATLRPASPARSVPVRKRASHASLAPSSKAVATHERPRSRVGSNTASKPPPDDSFLARMMRPTASSASKVQDKKPEAKSPPRLAKSAKAPQRKVTPKHEDQQNGNSAASTGEPSVVESSHTDDKDPPSPTPQQPEVVAEPDKLLAPEPEPAEAAIAEEAPSDTPMQTETEIPAAEEQAPNDTQVLTETETATEA